MKGRNGGMAWGWGMNGERGGGGACWEFWSDLETLVKNKKTKSPFMEFLSHSASTLYSPLLYVWCLLLMRCHHARTPIQEQGYVYILGVQRHLKHHQHSKLIKPLTGNSTTQFPTLKPLKDMTARWAGNWADYNGKWMLSGNLRVHFHRITSKSQSLTW